MGKRKLITRREAYKLQTVVRKLQRLHDETPDMLVQDTYRQCIALCGEVLKARAEKLEQPPGAPAPDRQE